MSAGPEPAGPTQTRAAQPGTGGGTGKPSAQLAYLARALRAPVVAEVFERLAERAREEGWAYEEYLAAVLDRQVSARAANGTQLRINAAHAGHRVLFDTAAGWITRLQQAHAKGDLASELARLARYPLLVVDEVGYIPFDADAANLFFQLVSSRYEHASLIITSNMAFSRWGEVFNDDIIAAAMIDRLVHHAEVVPLKGDSYRTKNRREQLASTTVKN